MDVYENLCRENFGAKMALLYAARIEKINIFKYIMMLR
jgi:hypothetical protein